MATPDALTRPASRPQPQPAERHPLEIYGILCSALLVVAYAVFCLAQTNLPFTDLPNHTARAAIIADALFHGGAEYGSRFSFEPGFLPYILGDVLLALLVELFSPALGARLYLVLFAILPALAMGCYARTLGLSPVATALVISLGLLLGTDQTFTQAFANYRLSLALVFVALAFAERFRVTGATGWALAFAATTVLAHLMHLAATLIIGAAVGVTACVASRETTRNRAALFAMLLVPAALLGFQTLSGRDPGGEFFWNSPEEKARGILGLFNRYQMPLPWDRILTVGLYGLLALGALRIRALLASPAARTGIPIAAACLIAYLVLPTSKGTTSIDLRLLPPALAFGAIAVLGALDARNGMRSRAGLAMATAALLLPAANLAYLSRAVAHENAVFGEVRAALQSLPRGATVLPFELRYEFGRAYIHASAFAVTDRAAFTPHLFSGDQGEPQVYFRYRDRPPTPHEYAWAEPAHPVDIDSLRRNWPYILVVGPHAGWQAPLPVTTLAQSENALLLRVEPAHRGPSTNHASPLAGRDAVVPAGVPAGGA